MLIIAICQQSYSKMLNFTCTPPQWAQLLPTLWLEANPAPQAEKGHLLCTVHVITLLS